MTHKQEHSNRNPESEWEWSGSFSKFKSLLWKRWRLQGVENRKILKLLKFGKFLQSLTWRLKPWTLLATQYLGPENKKFPENSYPHFFIQYERGPRKTPQDEIWAISTHRKYLKKSDFRLLWIFKKYFRWVKIAQILPGKVFRGPLLYWIKNKG